jgi:hypothetical protein
MDAIRLRRILEAKKFLYQAFGPESGYHDPEVVRKVANGVITDDDILTMHRSFSHNDAAERNRQDRFHLALEILNDQYGPTGRTPEQTWMAGVANGMVSRADVITTASTVTVGARQERRAADAQAIGAPARELEKARQHYEKQASLSQSAPPPVTFDENVNAQGMSMPQWSQIVTSDSTNDNFNSQPPITIRKDEPQMSRPLNTTRLEVVDGKLMIEVDLDLPAGVTAEPDGDYAAGWEVDVTLGWDSTADINHDPDDPPQKWVQIHEPIYLSMLEASETPTREGRRGKVTIPDPRGTRRDHAAGTSDRPTEDEA